MKKQILYISNNTTYHYHDHYHHIHHDLGGTDTNLAHSNASTSQ